MSVPLVWSGSSSRQQATMVVSTGSTSLAFASIDMGKANLPDGFEKSELSRKPFGVEIGFVTDDVPAAMQRAIDAGATLVSDAQEKPWGQIVGYVRDKDGFLIELCTAMG